MAVKTMAERIYTAYLTGTETEFYHNGTTYTFTPEDLKDYINSAGVTVSWDEISSKPDTFPVDPGVAVEDAIDDTDIVAKFNALLASLRDAGIIEV